MNLPHSLLLDPVGKRAAAYTANHRLITETASPALLACAEHPGCDIQAFDPIKHAKGQPVRRPLPDWATPEVQARMQLVWLRPLGVQSEQERAEIPRA